MKYLFTLTPSFRLVGSFMLLICALISAPNAFGGAKTPLTNLDKQVEIHHKLISTVLGS